jgi:hypothetical protein
MAILPIDIQTVIAQLQNIGRHQPETQNAVLTQQHYGRVIETQTLLKDNQVNQLQQTNNQDKKVNPDTKGKYQQKQQLKKRIKKSSEETSKPDDTSSLFKDPDKGNFIDVKK